MVEQEMHMSATGEGGRGGCSPRLVGHPREGTPEGRSLSPGQLRFSEVGSSQEGQRLFWNHGELGGISKLMSSKPLM